MTIRQLITGLECVPVDIPEGMTAEEVLLDTEIFFRVPSASGQYSRIVAPVRITKERATPREKDVVVITTGVEYDNN